MNDEPHGWIIILPRVPSRPARHRMALWRRLRRSGAIALGQGVWALPDAPAAAPVLSDVDELVRAGGGTCVMLDATGHRSADAAALRAAYSSARTDEWAEFRADCDKYLQELAKEHRLGKYTLAELEEEEQSLERLRRWYRDLRVRGLLGITPTSTGTRALKECADSFDQYSEQVYARLGAQPG